MKTPSCWKPTAPEKSRLFAFQQWLAHHHHLSFKHYHELHHWSVQQFPLFWKYLTDFFKFPFDTPPSTLFQKTGPELFENQWFTNATFNTAALMLDHSPEKTALISHNEQGLRQHLTYAQLKQAVQACAAGLQAIGVKPLDRVAAVMPNIPETIIAMLATAQLGAIWCACSPEFGAPALLDRFERLQPIVLLISLSTHYGGRTFSHDEKLPLIKQRLPCLKRIILWDLSHTTSSLPHDDLYRDWSIFVNQYPPLQVFTAFPFSHPLYILFSSGTTGKPKCMLHGAGNVLIQHIKEIGLHADLSEQDNLFFYTTCGWMMWNWMVSGLALGMTLTLYDGAPLFSTPDHLFSIIEREKVTAFGTSASYLKALEKTHALPRKRYDLSSLHLILSTGSPLLPYQYDYVYQAIHPTVRLNSISGGTDIVSCFVLGNPLLPIYRGEIQCAALGLDVQVFNETGQACIDQKGELVCKNPFPSMPLGFWQDHDNSAYRHAYFERFPSVWTQGDFAEQTHHHGFIIYGRSDLTLNPGGVRIGSAEIYREIEKIATILESAVIGLPLNGEVKVILFITLARRKRLTTAFKKEICHQLKTNASPRHVPDRIIQLPSLPKTFNGKIAETTLRQLLLGEKIQNKEALVNPESLNEIESLLKVEKLTESYGHSRNKME